MKKERDVLKAKYASKIAKSKKAIKQVSKAQEASILASKVKSKSMYERVKASKNATAARVNFKKEMEAMKEQMEKEREARRQAEQLLKKAKKKAEKEKAKVVARFARQQAKLLRQRQKFLRQAKRQQEEKESELKLKMSKEVEARAKAKEKESFVVLAKKVAARAKADRKKLRGAAIAEAKAKRKARRLEKARYNMRQKEHLAGRANIAAAKKARMAKRANELKNKATDMAKRARMEELRLQVIAEMKKLAMNTEVKRMHALEIAKRLAKTDEERQLIIKQIEEAIARAKKSKEEAKKAESARKEARAEAKAAKTNARKQAAVAREQKRGARQAKANAAKRSKQLALTQAYDKKRAEKEAKDKAAQEAKAKAQAAEKANIKKATEEAKAKAKLETQKMAKQQRALDKARKKARAEAKKAKLNAMKAKQDKAKDAQAKKVAEEKARLEKEKEAGKGKARYIGIKLSRANNLFLTMVKVFAQDEDVAKGKRTKQSSTYDIKGDDTIHNSSKAVDGNPETYTWTNNRNAYWSVDLGGYFEVDRIEVATISEKIQELKKATVYALDGDKKKLFKKNLEAKEIQDFAVNLKPKVISIDSLGPQITNYSTIAMYSNNNKKYCKDDYVKKQWICDGEEIEKPHQFIIINPKGGSSIKSGDQILLQSYRNKYCMSEGNKKRIYCNSRRATSKTIFIIDIENKEKPATEDALNIRGNQLITLKAVKDKSYCSVRADNQIGCFIKEKGEKELFRIILVKKGTKTDKLAGVSTGGLPGLPGQMGSLPGSAPKLTDDMKKKLMAKYKLSETQFTELVKLLVSKVATRGGPRAATLTGNLSASSSTTKKTSSISATSKLRTTDKLYYMGHSKDGTLYRKTGIRMQTSSFSPVNAGNNIKTKKIHYNRTQKTFFGISTDNILLQKTSNSIQSSWKSLKLKDILYVTSYGDNIYALDINKKLYTIPFANLKENDISLSGGNSKWKELKNSGNMNAIAIGEDNIMIGIDGKNVYKKVSIDKNSEWTKIDSKELNDIEFRTGYLFGVGVKPQMLYRKRLRDIKSPWVNYQSCCLIQFTFGHFDSGESAAQEKARKEKIATEQKAAKKAADTARLAKAAAARSTVGKVVKRRVAKEEKDDVVKKPTPVKKPKIKFVAKKRTGRGRGKGPSAPPGRAPPGRAAPAPPPGRGRGTSSGRGRGASSGRGRGGPSTRGRGRGRGRGF